MPEQLNKKKLLLFLERLGGSARTPGRCYITGGTSAVMIGWRQTTIDVDLKFEPEPEGVFDAIPLLKRELQLNVELAAPDQFIPPLPSWQERSQFIDNFAKLEVYHYDFVSQALSKLSRGHERDLSDVRQMLKLRLVNKSQILQAFEEIKPLIKRYPALDEDVFSLAVNSFCRALSDET